MSSKTHKYISINGEYIAKQNKKFAIFGESELIKRPKPHVSARNLDSPSSDTDVLLIQPFQKHESERVKICDSTKSIHTPEN